MPGLTLTDLKSQFTGDVLDPTSPDYRASLARWASNASRLAALVLFPRTNEDIALALTYARSQSPPLIVAVREGGHSASGASSVGPEGLVIDLSKYFNTAQIDEIAGEQVVRAGGGAVWETVDKEAIKVGRATVGGTVNHTGVGGLVLGGGYGWLSGQYGLSIDNLVEVTIIPGTPPYAPLTVSATSHPDLFWALQGGGSNFGIVTSFVLRTYPQRQTVFAGMLVFPPVDPVVKSVVERVEAWRSAVAERQSLEEKQAIMMPVGTSPGGQAGVVTILFYNGPEDEARENFKFLYELNPVVDTTKMIPYEELNGLQNGVAVGGKNWYMKGVTLHSLSPALVSRVLEIVSARSFETKPGSEVKTNMQANAMFEMFPLSKICAVSKSETAFSGRGKRMNVLVLVRWDVVSGGGSEDEEEMLAYVRETVGLITRAVDEFDRKEGDGNTAYANYAGEDEKSNDKARANFGENYARLQAVKKVYDPERVFMKWFPIEPAV